MVAPSAKALCLGLALLATGGLLCARRVSASRRAARSAATLSASVSAGDPLLHVPHAPGPITLDGDTDDPGWLRPPGPARTGDFVFADGTPARPYSETRAVWSGEYLYLSLYASDQDIESHTDQPDDAILPDDDVFRVVFRRDDVEYLLEVTPKALITDSIRRGGGAWDVTWNSGAHASMEIDGRMNDPKGNDEEWGIELAVPFEALGMKGEVGENIGMSLSRCDIPKRGPRTCAAWGKAPTGQATGRIVLE